MKTENGKIIEATRNELYHQWLTGDWDEFCSFPDFLVCLEEAGVKITGGDEDGENTAAVR